MQLGLVLSGGGARCFAQIGALQAFEEHDVEVTAIAANSAAGFIGALFAAGHSAAGIYQIFSGADYSTLLDFKGGGGLLGHEDLETLLAEHLPETFEDLNFPLVVPTVDIRTAERVMFSSGPLIPALCASNAFPGLFRPVTLGGRQLMDGGILSNVPLDLIRPLTSAPILRRRCQAAADQDARAAPGGRGYLGTAARLVRRGYAAGPEGTRAGVHHHAVAADRTHLRYAPTRLYGRARLGRRIRRARF